jgi:hypothetical protein
MLRVSPGALVTAIGWVLGVFDWGTDAGALAVGAEAGALAGLDAAEAGEAGEVAVALSPELPPPPPQPVSATDSTPAARIRDTIRIGMASPVSASRPA